MHHHKIVAASVKHHHMVPPINQHRTVGPSSLASVSCSPAPAIHSRKHPVRVLRSETQCSSGGPGLAAYTEPHSRRRWVELDGIIVAQTTCGSQQTSLHKPFHM